MKQTILALALLMLTAGGVSAQGNGKGTQRGTNKNCPSFVDNNKDGICDNLGTNNCSYGKGQGRGQGRMGAGRGQGCNGQGLRNGGGRGNNGQSRNFIDANNNGICDTFENAAKKQ